jgi:hypothetical protein
VISRTTPSFWRALARLNGNDREAAGAPFACLLQIRRTTRSTSKNSPVIAGWPVQFLPPTGPLVEEALAEALTVQVGNIPVRVFTAEHLAAIALQAGRAKDKARVLQFIEAGVLDSKRFQAILDHHHLTEAWEKFARQFLTDKP